MNKKAISITPDSIFPSKLENKSTKARISNKSKLRSIETIAPLLEKLETLSKSPESRELQQKTYRELKESLIRGEK